MSEVLTLPQGPLLPPLYKKSGAKVQIWRIWVEPQPDLTAVIVTEYGQVDGQQQQARDHIKEGKNLGRSNATTAIEQAHLEAKAKHTKQLERKGYGLDSAANESAAKRAAAPMLALDYLKFLKHVDWANAFAQPKFDGFRCIARNTGGVITLESREGKPINTMRHLLEPLAAALPEGVAFDGELYLPGEQFQKIASWIKREQADSQRVQYHIYDAQLPGARYEDRLALLEDRLGSGIEQLMRVETHKVEAVDELMRFQSEFIGAGYEGAMLRQGLGGYDAGKRSKSLLKVKVFQDAEFPIVGVREGTGTYAGMAIFQCRTDAGHHFDVTAPGTLDDKRAAYEQRHTLIGRRLTCKYFELTTGDAPVPRFPVALRLHETAAG